METREVAPLKGVTLAVAPLKGVTRAVAPLMGEIGVPPTGMIGEVSSFGWVRPAPGLARRVMRTVSFFRGTPAVFEEGDGGGVGWVLFESLIGLKGSQGTGVPEFQKKISLSAFKPSIPFSIFTAELLLASYPSRRILHLPFLKNS